LQLLQTFQEFELVTGLCNQDLVEHFLELRQRREFNPNLQE